MPEWRTLPLPRHLLARGVRDMLHISDAQVCGAAFGAAILHVSPEAAVGGPLALVRDGDLIAFNLSDCRRDLLVDEDERERRRAQWRAPNARHTRGYRVLYSLTNAPSAIRVPDS